MTQLALFDPGDVPPPPPAKVQPTRPRWSAYKGARRLCDRCVEGCHSGEEAEVRTVRLVRTVGTGKDAQRRYYCSGHGNLARDLDAASAPKRTRRSTR